MTTEKGVEVVLVDPAKAAKSPCDLPPCKAAEREEPGAAAAVRRGRYAETSPDGKTAFIRDWNLWVRDVATGKETQLTTDGVKDFGYATDNAGWTRSDRPILRWSPDSKKIATFQQDQRGVGEMYLVEHDGRPSDAAGLEVSAARRQRRHDDPARRHRRRHAARWSGCSCRRTSIAPRCATTSPAAATWGDVQWSPDGSHRRVRLDVARSQARTAARRRRRDRRRSAT